MPYDIIANTSTVGLALLVGLAGIGVLSDRGARQPRDAAGSLLLAVTLLIALPLGYRRLHTPVYFAGVSISI